MTQEKNIFGIFTFPLEKSGLIPLSQIVKILNSVGQKIYLISGNSALDYFSEEKNLIVDGVVHSTGKNFIFRLLRYIRTQVILSYKILKYSAKVDIWVSIFGSQLIFPTILVKLTRKKIIHIIAGSSSKSLKSQNDPFSFIIQIISTITNCFSDYIVVYSPLLMDEFGLKMLKKKIFIAPRHYVDFELFFLIKPIAERENIIGFIGRLSKEKGILNFLEAITILSPNNDLKYLIIGEGDEKRKVIHFINKKKSEINIQFLGWIDHNSLNYYINKIKLLVIPSYTEGLPNMMLEAMASGTLVLASKVGAIPDILIDGKTGFFLENNKPKTISEKITEIMKRDDLSRISTNGIRYIENNFTFRNAQKRYRAIIDYIARR